MKRKLKLYLVKKEFETLIIMKKNKIKALKKTLRVFKKKYLKNYWIRFKNYQPIIKENDDESNDKSSIDNNSISENRENLIEDVVNEDTKIIISTNEPVALENEGKGLIKSKLFILNEANFIKPTLASSYRKAVSPELKPPKIPKMKPLKNKKSPKKKATRTAYINDIIQENKRDEEVLRIRMASEVKLNNQSTNSSKKYEKVKSKVHEFRIRPSIRSSSYIPNRKIGGNTDEKIEKQENIEENNQGNKPILHPTLGFKQALPDLYKFIENYKPNIKKIN